jgi:hypothetical protein
MLDLGTATQNLIEATADVNRLARQHAKDEEASNNRS